jgi:phosphatidylglycerol:prolipoprotein diacylglycerol transferase
MMSLGFLAAFLLTRKALPHYGIDPRIAPIVLVLVVFGGILGTKLYYATDVWIRDGAPWLDSFSRSAGMTWYGGLLGGAVGAWISALRCGISFLALLEAAAVALPIGQAIGRLGCFLVGDDYGIPSTLPWAVAFPAGSPPTLDRVHPTQLYELTWLLAAALFLSRRRHKSPRLFAEYLIANGFGRFWIEFLRFNPVIALGLTEPQWTAIGLVAGGLLWWNASRRETVPIG